MAIALYHYNFKYLTEDIMTPSKADQIIKDASQVTVYNRVFGETFTKTFITRDRFNITSSDGNIYDRAELKIVK